VVDAVAADLADDGLRRVFLDSEQVDRIRANA
jgi:hypothetical protein